MRGGLRAGIGVRTLFAITPDSVFRGESPRNFRVRHDAISPFSGESTPFRLESGEFSRQFRPIHHGQPRPRIPSATAPFPACRPAFCPRLSRRPPGASRGPPARPYDLAGTLGGRSGPGGEAVEGREYTYTERATTEKINKRHHLPGAPITIVLRAVRV